MIIFFIIIPILYCEWLWKRVVNKKKSYDEALKLLTLISLFVALFVSVTWNPKFVIYDGVYILMLLLYRIVIFPYRKEKLKCGK